MKNNSDLFGSEHFPAVSNPLFEAVAETRFTRRVLGKANWQHYSECLPSVNDHTRQAVDDLVSTFDDDVIISAVQNCIPLSSSRPGRPPVFWRT